MATIHGLLLELEKLISYGVKKMHGKWLSLKNQVEGLRLQYSVADFYDKLSSEYQLIYKDWDQSVRWHSQCIDEIILANLQKQRSEIKILDCSCGIGTQAIGLDLLGYIVHGTDISSKEIEKAKVEADRLGADLSFGVADFRTLNEQVTEKFDVVISFDNSLPHLLNQEEMLSAFANINEKLHKDGLFLASIRDYDGLIEEKPKALPPYVHEEENGKRIVLQVWDWEENDIYIVNHYLIKQNGQECITTYNSTRYRAIKRFEISELLKEKGFNNIEWLMPEDTGFYQPIVVAKKVNFIEL